MNSIDILIISNKFDFTTDYICLELDRRKQKYLRINRDEFSNYKIRFYLQSCMMEVEIDDRHYTVCEEKLRSIYYRAPIYLRDIYRPNISEEEQLFRTQWTAFIRNLSCFENVVWVNNPTATFKAENKMLQLKYAQELGFFCPKTIVTNDSSININNNKQYIAKSLDTAVLRICDKEAFVYSNLVTGGEIRNSVLNIAPTIIQEYIGSKIDVRVTVIGELVYSVRILKNKIGIEGDWRKEKENVVFDPFQLPSSIHDKCIALLKKLNLSFGAIDLVESNNKFYFIEINPTGEWGWLVDNSNLKIHEGICDYLEGENKKNGKDI